MNCFSCEFILLLLLYEWTEHYVHKHMHIHMYKYIVERSSCVRNEQKKKTQTDENRTTTALPCISHWCLHCEDTLKRKRKNNSVRTHVASMPETLVLSYFPLAMLIALFRRKNCNLARALTACPLQKAIYFK